MSLRDGLGNGGGLATRDVVSVEDAIGVSSSSFSSSTVSTGAPLEGVCLCLRAVAPGAARVFEAEGSSDSGLGSARLRIDVG